MKISLFGVLRPSGLWWAALPALVAASVSQASYTQVLRTPAAGDAQYYWNSRYAGEGYSGVGELTLGASSNFYSGVPSDTQYTVGIFMIPITSLHGGELFSADLTVNVIGFGTWYYYGSASLGKLSVSDSAVLTGDVVADGLGPLAKGRPSGYSVFNSDIGGSGAAGLVSFDVTAAVAADLAAGHDYSVFVLSASRDTSGSISSAESGSGAFLTAVTSIPEPASAGLWVGVIACGFAGGLRRRKKNEVNPVAE